MMKKRWCLWRDLVIFFEKKKKTATVFAFTSADSEHVDLWMTPHIMENFHWEVWGFWCHHLLFCLKQPVMMLPDKPGFCVKEGGLEPMKNTLWCRKTRGWVNDIISWQPTEWICSKWLVWFGLCTNSKWTDSPACLHKLNFILSRVLEGTGGLIQLCDVWLQYLSQWSRVCQLLS